MHTNKSKTLLALLIATALSACSGSGGGSGLSAAGTGSNGLNSGSTSTTPNNTGNNGGSTTDNTGTNTNTTTGYSPVLDAAAIKDAYTKIADKNKAIVTDPTTSSTESLTVSITKGTQTDIHLTKSDINLNKYLPHNELTDLTMQTKHTLTYNVSQLDQKQYRYEKTENVRAYNQNYSTVVGFDTTGIETEMIGYDTDKSEKKPYSDKLMDSYAVTGVSIEQAALPATGSYTYTGKAFTATDNDGVLNYTINFDKKSGSGSITGIDKTGEITLKEGRIGTYTHGTKTSTAGIGETQATTANGTAGTYTLGIFGANAEEVAGTVNFKGLEHVGFGGKR
ncbi:factor H binding family protein [Kingella kingae]|uniref:factor H binding protein domain-containing protein n=1 Tax=Kingella kingae TaxID=504 RepID=UPI00254DEEB5|nr:factor H binding protein domain-containing protein [Kingella kingae]MDK4564230.1 factor H binding family protein [Kingella kingae]MDK4577612.1 factor H binding family protein [Kingella kingae]MDK4608156.1 factor H binding family protein [Kingella kingae]MDK4627377.1 factor H binding family protein [Kingella kingae]MDK4673948.1 factor H binding family protein [Kingella kingae]